MRSVDNRINRKGPGTGRYQDGNALACAINREVWNEQAAGPVFLRRERPFSQIERQVLKEPAIVIEGLRLSAAEWIYGHTKTRGPLIRKCVMRANAIRTGAADHLFLFPAHPEKSGNVLIEAPGVRRIGCVVIRERRECWVAKFRTNHL